MKKTLAFIMIVAMVFAIAGCGKNSKNNMAKEKNNTSGSGGEISIFSYKPDTLCPILSKNEANIQMLNNMYDGLISLSENLYPEAALAESWSVSEDGLKWTFILRQDAVWHDGTAFDAKDVIYTVNQIKANGESVYSYNVSLIKDIKEIGSYEVDIELNEPWPNFVSLLYFPIIKSGTDEIDAANYQPIGTGPYKFEDRGEGNVFYLVRNENWWGGKAVSDCIAVKMLPDNNTALYAFSSGSIDMTTPDDMNWGRFVDPVSASYTSIQTPIFHFLGINHESGALKFPEVRKAISYSIDRQNIIDEVMMGYATPAGIPVHPDWFVCGDNKLEYHLNKNAAKKIMADNDWKLADGVYTKTVEDVDTENSENSVQDTAHVRKKEYKTEFRIIFNKDNEHRKNIAELLEKSLEPMGFNVVVQGVDYEEYSERIENGNYDIFIGSYIISPELKFSFIIGEGNVFRFTDDEMNSAIENLKNKRSISGIEEGFDGLIKSFEELNPVIGLFFKDNILVYSNRIEGEIKSTYFDLYRGIENLRKEEAR